MKKYDYFPCWSRRQKIGIACGGLAMALIVVCSEFG